MKLLYLTLTKVKKGTEGHHSSYEYVYFHIKYFAEQKSEVLMSAFLKESPTAVEHQVFHEHEETGWEQRRN